MRNVFFPLPFLLAGWLWAGVPVAGNAQTTVGESSVGNADPAEATSSAIEETKIALSKFESELEFPMSDMEKNQSQEQVDNAKAGFTSGRSTALSSEAVLELARRARDLSRQALEAARAGNRKQALDLFTQSRIKLLEARTRLSELPAIPASATSGSGQLLEGYAEKSQQLGQTHEGYAQKSQQQGSPEVPQRLEPTTATPVSPGLAGQGGQPAKPPIGQWPAGQGPSAQSATPVWSVAQAGNSEGSISTTPGGVTLQGLAGGSTGTIQVSRGGVVLGGRSAGNIGSINVAPSPPAASGRPTGASSPSERRSTQIQGGPTTGIRIDRGARSVTVGPGGIQVHTSRGNDVTIGGGTIGGLGIDLGALTGGLIQSPGAAASSNTISVAGSRQNQTYDGLRRNFFVAGNTNRVIIRGEANVVQVGGNHNIVEVDAVAQITVGGNHNQVFWRRGLAGRNPAISRVGSYNTVSQIP